MYACENVLLWRVLPKKCLLSTPEFFSVFFPVFTYSSKVQNQHQVKIVNIWKYNTNLDIELQKTNNNNKKTKQQKKIMCMCEILKAKKK